MVINGTGYYCKVLGKPANGYKNQYKEWSFDLAITDETRKALINAGMDSSFVKNKGDDRGDFITFKRREFRKDGTAAKPFEVVDRKQQPWDQTSLIGNGSKLNVKIALNEQPERKGLKPGAIKIQIVEHVPYEGRAGDDEDLPMYNDDGSENWD